MYDFTACVCFCGHYDTLSTQVTRFINGTQLDKETNDSPRIKLSFITIRTQGGNHHGERENERSESG